MALKKLLVALASIACASAMAQAPLGSVTNVQGVVTATQGTTGTTVIVGTPITNGARFVATSTGSVTLRLNSGCVVTVPSAHAVTVLQSMTCEQLTAAVQPVSATATLGQGPVFTSDTALLNGIIVVTGAAIVIGGIREFNRDDDERVNVSPN
jgi:hypothetical protein